MNQERKIIIANWKMNGNLHHYIEFVKNLFITDDKEIVICPAHCMISPLKQFSSNVIKFGAQDCSEHVTGAFTGEVSAEMLADIGCEYVILGHSERRKYHNEDSHMVNNKIRAARQAGLKPIICVGETQEVREQSNHLDYITNQINELAIKNIQPPDFIIAYEPLWAIGNGVTANVNQISEVHDHISKMFEKKIKIVYGGSINEKDAFEILKITNNYGALIGNASTNLEKFRKIIN